jgi:hypothetical protein
LTHRLDQDQVRFMSAEYTFHVGEKFHPDGRPRSYPGSTVICPLDPASPIYRAGVELQAELAALPFGHKFALLPPASFHMTVFSLICDQQRVRELWSSRLPLDAPLEETDRFFIEAVTPVTPPPGLRMALTFIGGWGMSFRLCPADETTYFALKNYRELLSRATGVRYPDHDSYEFHITLAYSLQWLDEDEAAAYLDFRTRRGDHLRRQIDVVALEAPALTFFEDMFAFVPAAARFDLPSRRGTRPDAPAGR